MLAIASHYADIPIIDRAAVIINIVSECHGGVSATSMLKDLRIPKTTFYRILNSLVKNGFLTFDSATNLYYLGNKFSSASMIVDEQLQMLKKNAQPYLQKLATQVKETVKLSVLSNSACYVLCKVEGTQKIRISVDVGTSFPLHAGASSKILLSGLGADGIHKYFSKPVEKYTDCTITSEQAFLEEMDRITKEGHSLDRGEYMEGIGAAACPITDVSGRIMAAISIAFATMTTQEDEIHSMVLHLKAVAKILNEMLASM